MLPLKLPTPCYTPDIHDLHMCIICTNGVHHIYGIFNLHYDFKKQVLINNCSLFLFVILLFYFHIYKL